jgi:hypothetical protein
MAWPLRAGALLVALLVLLVAPAGAAAQTGSEFYGVNVEPLIKLGIVAPDQWNSYIAKMAAAGMSVARSDANWFWVEPNDPGGGPDSYDWDNPASDTLSDEGATAVYQEPESMDNLVRILAQNHVRFVPVLDGSPQWAQGSYPDVLQSSYYPNYANYAGAFAARYGPGGSFWSENPDLPYLPVEQYEVWTEGNSTDFWTGELCGGYDADGTEDLSQVSQCASDYAAGLEQVSTAIHAVQPGSVVMASIGWQHFATYLGDLYSSLASDGAPANTINAIGFHPYGVDAPAIIELDEQMRSELQAIAADPSTAAYASASLPIYDSEDGQPTVASGPGATFSWEGEVTDASRAAMMSLASDALARGDCGVEDYLVYGIVGSGISTADGGELNDEGLMGL